jgi:hypothetical protein
MKDFHAYNACTISAQSARELIEIGFRKCRANRSPQCVVMLQTGLVSGNTSDRPFIVCGAPSLVELGEVLMELRDDAGKLIACAACSSDDE